MSILLESVDSFGIPLIEDSPQDDIEALLAAMGSTGEVHMVEFEGEFHPKTEKDRMILKKLGLPETFSEEQYDSVLAGLGKVGLGIVTYNDEDEGGLTEDFKTSAKRFQDQGADQAEIDTYFTNFKQLKPRIPEADKRDIDRWASWEEFKAFIDELKSGKSKTQLKKLGQEYVGEDIPGAKLVAEDAYWWVFKITSFEAARKIGSKTQWCIIANETHWKHFVLQNQNQFFFYISKRLKPSVKWFKIAAQVEPDGEITYWDAEDKSHDSGSSTIPFKIPPIPESEIDEVEDRDESTTFYLAADISREHFDSLLSQIRGFDSSVWVEMSLTDGGINVTMPWHWLWVINPHKRQELRYFIKACLEEMGYTVEEISGALAQ